MFQSSSWYPVFTLNPTWEWFAYFIQFFNLYFDNQSSWKFFHSLVNEHFFKHTKNASIFILICEKKKLGNFQKHFNILTDKPLSSNSKREFFAFRWKCFNLYPDNQSSSSLVNETFFQLSKNVSILILTTNLHPNIQKENFWQIFKNAPIFILRTDLYREIRGFLATF